MRVIKIQTKVYLCERHLEKTTTSPLSSHLLHYFHLTTSHKNLKYPGFIRQFKNLTVPNVQWKTSDDGHRRCPKHVKFYNRINLDNWRVWLVI
jgi:hypothetical protein